MAITDIKTIWGPQNTMSAGVTEMITAINGFIDEGKAVTYTFLQSDDSAPSILIEAGTSGKSVKKIADFVHIQVGAQFQGNTVYRSTFDGLVLKETLRLQSLGYVVETVLLPMSNIGVLLLAREV